MFRRIASSFLYLFFLLLILVSSKKCYAQQKVKSTPTNPTSQFGYTVSQIKFPLNLPSNVHPIIANIACNDAGEIAYIAHWSDLSGKFHEGVFTTRKVVALVGEFVGVSKITSVGNLQINAAGQVSYYAKFTGPNLNTLSNPSADPTRSSGIFVDQLLVVDFSRKIGQNSVDYQYDRRLSQDKYILGDDGHIYNIVEKVTPKRHSWFVSTDGHWNNPDDAMQLDAMGDPKGIIGNSLADIPQAALNANSTLPYHTFPGVPCPWKEKEIIHMSTQDWVNYNNIRYYPLSMKKTAVKDWVGNDVWGPAGPIARLVPVSWEVGKNTMRFQSDYFNANGVNILPISGKALINQRGKLLIQLNAIAYNLQTQEYKKHSIPDWCCLGWIIATPTNLQLPEEKHFSEVLRPDFKEDAGLKSN